MKFWDASAIVPLLLEEASTTTILNLYKQDSVVLVWWATEVECASALARLERENKLDATTLHEAFNRLQELRLSWHEIQPIEQIRSLARRLLRMHSLRGADSLQLAAAIIASNGHPEHLDFVCLDARLVVAAEREGFGKIFPPS